MVQQMNINYEYYRIFYYAAKYKNLTQAAKALHNSQPNISRAIKLLEHEMGCRLFIRSNRGITLTPEGERLYSHVKIAVEHLICAEDEIANAAQMQNGCVTIGASETALRMLVLPVLRLFKEHYPRIRIRILNHLTMQAVLSVKEGGADFAVVAAPPRIESPLLSCPLMQFRDVLIAGPSYSGLAETPLSLTELAAYPLVSLGEGTMTYQFYEEFYRSHQLSMKPELLAATTDQILPMIKNDLGIGYIPEIFAAEALEHGEVCRLSLAEGIPFRQICLVENEQYPLTIAARELKSLLINFAKKTNPYIDF